LLFFFFGIKLKEVFYLRKIPHPSTSSGFGMTVYVDTMKKVVLFGAKGTLGQALCDEFVSQGYMVIGLDHSEIDITDYDKVKEKLLELSPDIIINSTGVNAVDKIEQEEAMYELAKNINGLAVENMARVSKDLGSSFVHYSTDYVFDGKKGTAYTEQDIPAPLSRYAETKLLGETLVQSVGGKFFIIRISRLFGKAGMSSSSKRSFVDTMLALSKEKDHLDIVSDQVGSPTYAPDAARFTRILLEGEYAPGIYHGTNSGECSWYDWALKIFALKNISIDVAGVSHTQFPRPARAPLFSALENTKLSPQRSWEEALREYLLS
jgi:dTDP-4-dehydrorhamnose reductase